MIRKLILSLALGLGVSFAAGAANEAKHPHKLEWSFEGPFGKYDTVSVQRGFQVYKEVCAACHSMNYLSYRHLGEKGGPFYGEMVKDKETGEHVFKLGSHHHGKPVKATDNPMVKAIAAESVMTVIDPDTGDLTDVPATAASGFQKPYANPAAAAAANGGAIPPDFSSIINARHGGADYLHALLTGYGQEMPADMKMLPGLHYNPYFPGMKIAMAAPLSEGRVTYEDGTVASVDQMSRDVATFLAWASDPKMETRKALGIQVLIYLFILSCLVYVAYRRVWADVKKGN